MSMNEIALSESIRRMMPASPPPIYGTVILVDIAARTVSVRADGDDVSTASGVGILSGVPYTAILEDPLVGDHVVLDRGVDARDIYMARNFGQ